MAIRSLISDVVEGRLIRDTVFIIGLQVIFVCNRNTIAVMTFNYTSMCIATCHRLNALYFSLLLLHFGCD